MAMGIREYVFGFKTDRRGRVLPFSRFDIALSVMLGFTLLAIISFSAEPNSGWTRSHIIIVLAVLLAVGLAAQHRKIVFGCGAGIVALRFAIAVFLGSHALFFAAAAVLFAVITWFLLKDV
jgi:hypothetical protein